MTSLLWSQDSQQEKLEERKIQIQKEIRENEKLLQSVKKKEKSAVNVVIIQSTKIKLKEKLINTTEKQTKLLSNDMYINQMQINKLEKELLTLKEDYAKMIVKSYKSRSSESRAMFILSSESFLQAYKRAQYMKQYTSYRKMQGEEIKTKTKELSNFNDKLSIQKTAKQKLIAENVKERLSLEKEKQQQVNLVNVLKKDKNKIAREIGKKQQEYRIIDRQINRRL
jgi:septal ring factor EnvC (AmiA/AmiB activator)